MSHTTGFMFERSTEGALQEQYSTSKVVCFRLICVQYVKSFQLRLMTRNYREASVFILHNHVFQSILKISMKAQVMNVSVLTLPASFLALHAREETFLCVFPSDNHSSQKNTNVH